MKRRMVVIGCGGMGRAWIKNIQASPRCELAGLVDSISVSLNAADAPTYEQLCHTPFGTAGFDGVCAFLVEAKKHIPQVVATAVTVPGLDVAAVRRLADSLGVAFREREYAEVG